MRLVVGIFALAACYAPKPHAGAACNDTSPCPVEQACMRDVCVTKGGAADLDGDGVADGSDNCPAVANSDQANEDGDQFGDACDPCPPEANDAPSDPDGDGVADRCDPNPDTPGDEIVVFEGFHAGLPADWQVVGSATPMADSIVLVAAAGTHALLALPVAPPGNGAISVGLVSDQTVGTSDADLGPALDYDVAGDHGILCWLRAASAANPATRDTTLYDHSATRVQIAKGTLAWVDGTAYAVSLAKTGTSYTCTVTPPGGAPVTMTGTSTTLPPSASMVVRLYAATANVQWVMVVSSP